MQLDLTKDRPSFVEWIGRAIEQLSSEPGRFEAEPITRLDVSFDVSSMDIPVVYVGYSTNPGGEPGHKPEWVLDHGCPHWAEACDAALRGSPVRVTIGRNRTMTVEGEEGLCEAVGLFFVDLLKAMRDDGLFHALPHAQDCYLGVASYDGTYGWPRYEDRGPDNML
jgi:hypothetical protein